MNILICQLLLLIFVECLFVYKCKGYVLLSENRTAYQSSTYSTDTQAGKAVDGDLRQSWPNMAATSVSTSVDWYVDLGARRNIFNVVIYYRQERFYSDLDDFYRQRFAGFSLYISDDTNDKSGYNCRVNSTYPPLIYNVSCQYSGRYVRLYNSRNDKSAILELAEVQVFGCENSTVYGIKCENRCSSTCKNNRCHSFTGDCFSCADGYRLGGQHCVKCGECVGGSPCDMTTGKCTNGCISGMYPPFCNKGILSRGKITNMSPPFEIRTSSDKAVDGDTNQNYPNMAVTAVSINVFWYVDLGVPGNIQNVVIFYRDENPRSDYLARFAGFSLYISDDTNRKTGFKFDVDSNPELQYNVSCQYAGRFVKVYNDRSDGSAVLELGEVQVFGCLHSTMYGVDCETICPSTCKNNRCSVLTGYCFSCQAGYTGDVCNVSCPSEQYGEGCVFQCSGNCKDGESCDRFDGQCKNGCIPNYFGLWCNETCVGCKNGKCNQGSGQCENGCMPDYYNSPYCNKQCSGNCLNDVCDDNNGICTDGCKPTYYGSNCTFLCPQNCKDGENCDQNTRDCNDGCIPGYYGKQCNQICSNLCLNKICGQNTGACVNCTSGFYGFPNCDAQCSSSCKNNNPCNQNNGDCDNGCKHGYYGYNCTFPCSGNCQNNTNCNQLTGFCDKGCVAGYKGNKCDLECEINEYGDGCSRICGSCRNSLPCEKAHGICTNGCDRGFQLPYCIEICKHGTYGFDCNLTCTGNCKGNDPCNILTGLCDRGCADGWTGNRCDTECIPGRYGEDCLKFCSKNCKHGDLCHHVTGACKDGCKDGFHSDNCSLSCSENCLGKAVCNSSSGRCEEGCSAGWKGERCDVECDTNEYGPDCAKKCGKCRNGVPCNKITGRCIPGCSPGYLTQFCNESCTPGNFGDDCLLKCSGNCLSKITCNVGNGYCDDGCEHGWVGDRCDDEDKSNAQLIIGVSSGAGILVLLIILGVIALLLLRRLQQNELLSNNADKKVSMKDENNTTDHQGNTGQNTTDNTPGYINLNISSDQNTDKIDNTEYQELSEIRDNNTYDVISD